MPHSVAPSIRLKAALLLIAVAAGGWARATDDSGYFRIRVDRDATLCNHMLHAFQSDLAEKGRVAYLDHPEFAVIIWTPGRYRLSSATGLFERDVLYTRLDINNDGAKELVFKDSWSFRSNIHEALYADQESGIDFTKSPTMDLTSLQGLELVDISPAAPFEIENDQGVVFGGMYGGYVHPFIFGGRGYIALESRMPRLGGTQAFRIAIVEYLDAVPPSRTATDGHRLRTLCLFDEPE